MLTHVIHVLVGHRRVVDTQDDITLLQSHLCSGHTLVWLVNHHSLEFLMISHDSSYTRIFSREHHLEVLGLVLRIILGVGVETPQHGIDTIADNLLGIEGIDIHQVEVLVYIIKYVQVLCHLKIVVFLFLRRY